ncbi:AAA family ATPase [Clavibacter phaseoli]|uniref:AAA family ATPase n=1 Tax=Clavibacter phaseoli TaxID=1734031 RepID=UPI000E668DAA|nr:AAA family ATPase [Clavibacter phaseoli]RIJ60548.1 ATP-binding protein [Clavibacter phaseoli]
MYRLLHHENGPIAFSLDDGDSVTNRFTVVLGPNGRGKSQLLRSIAENYRNGEASEDSSSPFEAESRLEGGPSCLLVVSNMVMDVFTNTTQNRGRYRYLGLRQASNNSSTGSLRDATVGAMLECFGDPRRVGLLNPVLAAMHVKQCSVTITRTKKRSQRELKTFEVLQRFVTSLERASERRRATSIDALEAELRDLSDIASSQSVSHNLDSEELGRFWHICARFDFSPTDLVRLMRRFDGTDISIRLHFDERLVHIDDLSAGQLLFLSTFARVAANVEPHSLIVVDEPETGLHPNWQSAWIPLMRETLPAALGCHIFLATHSPYIVSDADDVLVPGEKWGTFVPFDEPFRGRSVENILYRVFSARIAGNLMVERDLTVLAQFISHQDEIRSDKAKVRDAISRLEEFSGQDTEHINSIIQQATRLML